MSKTYPRIAKVIAREDYSKHVDRITLCLVQWVRKPYPKLQKHFDCYTLKDTLKLTLFNATNKIKIH